MPAIPNRPRSQAPIFKRKPDLDPDRAPVEQTPVDVTVFPDVVVDVIFAAGRSAFEFLTPGCTSIFDAKRKCFEFLPLAENGWEHETAVIELVRTDPIGSVWRITKNSTIRRSSFVPASEAHPGMIHPQQNAPRHAADVRVGNSIHEVSP